MIVEQLIELLAACVTLNQLCASLVTFVVIKLLLFVRSRQKLYTKLAESHINGPQPARVFAGGNFYQLEAETDHDYDIHARWLRQYGDTYGYYMSHTPVVITTNLKLLAAVFYDHVDVFNSRFEVLMNVKTLTSSLLLAPAARWKTMRKILTPAFSVYGLKQSKSTAVVEANVEQMMKFLATRHKTLGSGEVGVESLDVLKLMQSLALNLITKIGISLKNCEISDNDAYAEQLVAFLDTCDSVAVNLIYKFPFLKPILEFVANNFGLGAVLTRIERQVSEEIDNGLAYLRKLEPQASDEQLRSIYGGSIGSGNSNSNTNTNSNNNTDSSNANAASNEAGNFATPATVIHKMILLHFNGKLTRDEVIGNALIVLIGGFDTTSTSLTYLLWVLASNESVQQQARQDVKVNGADSEYLAAVINETLRLYPPISMLTNRRTEVACSVAGFSLPANTTVHHNPELMHKSEQFWHEPLAFKPERFLNAGSDPSNAATKLAERADLSAKERACVFAPFGLGERRCVGYKVALLEMKQTLATLLLKYNVKLVSPSSLKLTRKSHVFSKPVQRVVVTLQLLQQH